ncbi:MAG TPA: hypothetical protein VFN38_10440 [Gemmatimonadaceae bacterium]|nr:hypothetical protein [Gemmatimonadaceae bacterium]
METNTTSTASDGSTAAGADLHDRIPDQGSGATESIRGKVGNMQAGLADLLDSSAQVIRSRGNAASDAADGAAGDGAAERLAASGEATAAVLERGAMWLRENDLSDIEERVTAELREHPARTLLVAAGVGFLLSRRR